MQAGPVLSMIADVISPYIGSMMAHSSIDLHCKTLGIHSGSIDKAQLEELLKRLALGLNIFIGREKTTSLVEAIRRDVEVLP